MWSNESEVSQYSFTATSSLYILETFYKGTGDSWEPGCSVTLKVELANQEYETLLTVSHDYADRNRPTTYIFNVDYSIPHSSSWFHNSGSYEISEILLDNAFSSWSQYTKGNYPLQYNSPNSYYVKTFSIAEGGLSSVSSFVLSLRYQHGCNVYLNSHAIFSHPTAAYESVLF